MKAAILTLLAAGFAVGLRHATQDLDLLAHMLIHSAPEEGAVVHILVAEGTAAVVPEATLAAYLGMVVAVPEENVAAAGVRTAGVASAVRGETGPLLVL